MVIQHPFHVGARGLDQHAAEWRHNHGDGVGAGIRCGAVNVVSIVNLAVNLVDPVFDVAIGNLSEERLVGILDTHAKRDVDANELLDAVMCLKVRVVE